MKIFFKWLIVLPISQVHLQHLFQIELLHLVCQIQVSQGLTSKRHKVDMSWFKKYIYMSKKKRVPTKKKKD